MVKRKGIPWGPKNPLWKWQHGKSNKKTEKVKEMVKRVSRKTRSRPRYKARHKRDMRMPLSAIVGITTSVFAPAAPGWSTVMDNIKAGNIDMAAQSFIRSWTGIALGGIGGQPTTEFNLMAALNPLNMNEAPAWKAMFWTALSAKIIKKVAKQDPLSKIPIINKFVKFS